MLAEVVKKLKGSSEALDGRQAAQVLALRREPPPEGFANWNLRLLAQKVVEPEIVDAISRETIRRALKKADWRTGSSSAG